MLDRNADRVEALLWLATADGKSLLAEADALPNDRLRRITRLRRLAPAAVAEAAVELLELRRRARAKFADADEMFFTPEGLEQATGDSVSSYRASRFPPGGCILDACSGIGGDARQLARRGQVLAVDCHPVSAVCTQLNCAISASYGTGESPEVATLCADATKLPQHDDEHENDYEFRVATVCADVTKLPLKRLAERGVTAAFFDPSRRAGDGYGGRRRISGAHDYSPPLEWANELREHFESVAVKVSPALDDASLAGFDGAKVEFISSRGECKEAVIWIGASANDLIVSKREAEPYFTTVLRLGLPPETLAPVRCADMETTPLRAHLYEPDPAVIRAHLIPQLAERLTAAWIEPGVAYITSDRHVPTPFATAFRVVEQLPYDRKEVQRRLRTLGAYIYSVKKRGVPLDPIEVRKGLDSCGSLALDLILMRRAGRVIAILCQRMETSAPAA